MSLLSEWQTTIGFVPLGALRQFAVYSTAFHVENKVNIAVQAH